VFDLAVDREAVLEDVRVVVRDDPEETGIFFEAILVSTEGRIGILGDVLTHVRGRHVRVLEHRCPTGDVDRGVFDRDVVRVLYEHPVDVAVRSVDAAVPDLGAVPIVPKHERRLLVLIGRRDRDLTVLKQPVTRLVYTRFPFVDPDGLEFSVIGDPTVAEHTAARTGGSGVITPYQSPSVGRFHVSTDDVAVFVDRLRIALACRVQHNGVTAVFVPLAITHREVVVVVDDHRRSGDRRLLGWVIARVDTKVCEVAVLEEPALDSHHPFRMSITDAVAAELVDLDVLKDGFSGVSFTVGIAVRVKADPGDPRSVRRPAVSVYERTVSPHYCPHDTVDAVAISTSRIEQLSRPAVALGKVSGPLDVSDQSAVIRANPDTDQFIVAVQREVIKEYVFTPVLMDEPVRIIRVRESESDVLVTLSGPPNPPPTRRSRDHGFRLDLVLPGRELDERSGLVGVLQRAVYGVATGRIHPEVVDRVHDPVELDSAPFFGGRSQPRRTEDGTCSRRAQFHTVAPLQCPPAAIGLVPFSARFFALDGAVATAALACQLACHCGC